MTRELEARPQCAICKRPVERFSEEVLDFVGYVRFKAQCHGAVEIVDLPIEGDSAVNGSLAFGVAFRRPAQITA
jgi:hypothetical protein